MSVDQHFNMSAGGILQLLIEASAWNSVISFQHGIPVALGGTLDLEFTSDTDVGAQVGRKIHLFDWSGVSPSGTFTIGGPYTWDVSQLYTAGDVTLVGSAGAGDGVYRGVRLCGSRRRCYVTLAPPSRRLPLLGPSSCGWFAEQRRQGSQIASVRRN